MPATSWSIGPCVYQVAFPGIPLRNVWMTFLDPCRRYHSEGSNTCKMVLSLLENMPRVSIWVLVVPSPGGCGIQYAIGQIVCAYIGQR